MDIDQEDYLVVQTLDAPARILFWTLDEVMVGFFFPLLGFVTGKLLLFLGLAVLSIYLLRKLKARGYHLYYRPMMYWFTKTFKTKAAPPSYIQVYLS